MNRNSGRIWLFLASNLFFLLFAYGGIRSPDGEIVFRTGVSLVRTGSWAVEDGLEWKDFGLSPGIDGKRYSIFGPGHVLLAYPIFALAEGITASQCPDLLQRLVSPSHFLGEGLGQFVGGRRPEPFDQHFKRSIVAIWNVPVASLAVLAFESVVFSLIGSVFAARLLAVLLGFGTCFLAYSGTFFAEPLVTLLLLISFKLLIEASRGKGIKGPVFSGLSGLVLGIAVTTHITAILSFPFFALMAFLGTGGFPGKENILWRNGVVFILACSIPLALLGWFNLVRFGSMIETGRSVPGLSPEVGYGTFADPVEGVLGLLFSFGKGLIWYSPLAFAGILFIRRFYREFPIPGLVLPLMVLARLLFIGSRSDWQGGFSLGPRYLVPVFPFMLLPLAPLAAMEDSQDGAGQDVRDGAPAGWFAVAVMAFAQQASFALFEVFTHLHVVRKFCAESMDPAAFYGFAYSTWETAPFVNVLSGRPASAILRLTGLPNQFLWPLAVVAGAFFIRLFLARGKTCGES